MVPFDPTAPHYSMLYQKVFCLFSLDLPSCINVQGHLILTLLLDVFGYGHVGIDCVFLQKAVYPQNNRAILYLSQEVCSQLSSSLFRWHFNCLSDRRFISFGNQLKSWMTTTENYFFPPTACYFQFSSGSGLMLMSFISSFKKINILFDIVKWIKNLLVENSENLELFENWFLCSSRLAEARIPSALFWWSRMSVQAEACP